jgi:arylsulfatase A-like enzyme
VEDARSAVVRRAVRDIDQDLGRLIEAFGPGATVVLVSDHGWDLEGNEHVFGPDGVLVVSPSDTQGFGGRADIYELAPTVLDLLGLPAESAMVARTVFDRPVRQRAARVIQTQRLRRAARPSADRLDLLKSVGYIARCLPS